MQSVPSVRALPFAGVDGHRGQGPVRTGWPGYATDMPTEHAAHRQVRFDAVHPEAVPEPASSDGRSLALALGSDLRARHIGRLAEHFATRPMFPVNAPTISADHTAKSEIQAKSLLRRALAAPKKDPAKEETAAGKFTETAKADDQHLAQSVPHGEDTSTVPFDRVGGRIEERHGQQADDPLRIQQQLRNKYYRQLIEREAWIADTEYDGEKEKEKEGEAVEKALEASVLAAGSKNTPPKPPPDWLRDSRPEAQKLALATSSTIAMSTSAPRDDPIPEDKHSGRHLQDIRELMHRSRRYLARYEGLSPRGVDYVLMRAERRLLIAYKDLRRGRWNAHLRSRQSQLAYIASDRDELHEPSDAEIRYRLRQLQQNPYQIQRDLESGFESDWAQCRDQWVDIVDEIRAGFMNRRKGDRRMRREPDLPRPTRSWSLPGRKAE